MPRIPASQKTATKPIEQPQPSPEPPPKPVQQPKASPVQVIERRIETVMIEVPLGEPPHRFDQVHLEGWLRGEPANTFARLRQALRDKNAKTENGRPIVSNADVLRWVIEQLGAQG